jgi:hypothetical protein
MAQKKGKPREHQIGKKQVAKKPLIDPKYKNTFWTIVVLVVLLIFFIINNTRSVPKQGPYPPGYNAATQPQPDTAIDSRLQMNTHTKEK